MIVLKNFDKLDKLTCDFDRMFLNLNYLENVPRYSGYPGYLHFVTLLIFTNTPESQVAAGLSLPSLLAYPSSHMKTMSTNVSIISKVSASKLKRVMRTSFLGWWRCSPVRPGSWSQSG